MMKMSSHKIKAKGKNRRGIFGYLRNIYQILGNPNGANPVPDGIARVQEGVSTDNSPRV